MKRLVLCVDRDDDLGVKTGIKSPVIGRDANLQAASQLLLADPEEADANAMFAAVKLHDELVNVPAKQKRLSGEDEPGDEVDVATVCGHPMVGRKSDLELSDQLDRVFAEVKPDSVLLVTDGAEDDHIRPLITSRVRVDGTTRVVVRQAQNLESFFYVVTKAIQDDKVRKRFLIPLAIAFLTLGIASLWKVAHVGQGFIMSTLGAYFLVVAFKWEEPVIEFGSDMRRALETGRYLTLGSLILSLFIIVFGLSQGWTAVLTSENTLFSAMVISAGASLWYFIVAGMGYTVGKTLDLYFHHGRLQWMVFVVLLSLLVAGLISSAVIEILRYLVVASQGPFEKVGFVMLYSFAALILGFFAWIIYGYVKERPGVNEETDKGPAGSEPTIVT